MSIGTGSFGAQAWTESRRYAIPVPGVPNHQGSNTHHVNLGMTSSAEVTTGSAAAVAHITLGFTTNAEVVGTNGPVPPPDRPTEWEPDVGVTVVWTPDNPVIPTPRS